MACRHERQHKSRQAHSLLRDLIKMRSRNKVITKTTWITVSSIIGKDANKVGLLFVQDIRLGFCDMLWLH